MRVTDLKTVVVATSDVEAAVAAFRETFGFPVTHRSAGTSLGIGAAEIEMRTTSGAAGLSELVLEVDDLAAARKALEARGIATKEGTGSDGRPLLRLRPSDTHGVRLALVGR